MANSVDPDQLASEEANWSRSTRFTNAEYMRVQQDIRHHSFFVLKDKDKPNQ